MGSLDQIEPIETASRDELRALQLRRLRETVSRAYERVPHYRKKFETAGVHPDDLKTIDDLAKFPLTTKEDLRQNYPFGMFAVPMDDIVRIHASSGTTGKATVVGYTRADIDMWARLMARSICAAGGRGSDKVHIAYGYGLFTGGLGFHYGAEALGCAVIPAGGGFTERQVQLITDFKPDIIAVTPSYLLAIADEFDRQGAGGRDSSLRIALCGAEPWTEGMRVEIEQRLGLQALDVYGLSEVIGPGVGQEYAETRDGLTIWEDHFLPEIVDPTTGRVLPDGEEGELVFTSLTKEAMPVIRYRTRDLTRLLPGTARTMRRIERIKGRSDDMLIIRGVNVFPTQIEAALAQEIAAGAALRARGHAAGPARRARRGGRTASGGRGYARRDGARGTRTARRASHQGAGGRNDDRPRRAGRHHRTLAGQGQARHRQAAQKMSLDSEQGELSMEEVSPALAAAGLSSSAIAEWRAAEPGAATDIATDLHDYAGFWLRSNRLLKELPRRPKRSAAEQAAAEAILSAARASRERFLAAHAAWVYDSVTVRCTRFLRLEDLVYAAAAAIPGLVPSRQEVAAEAALDQRDKDGAEIDQGIFLAHVLAGERTGLHLCHAMLLPRPQSAELAERFAVDGALDLGSARLERSGKAVHLTAANPRFLNAEDDTTLDAMEIAVDIATLDARSDIAVLRGGPVEHPNYAGGPVFGAGINLTHLYRGKIPYLWFLKRDMGYVHKLLRGVARPDCLPDDVHGVGIEKPWIAAVDKFAIGGHCQVLLCMDYIVAGADAFMSLPARKEGIIPGLANLRLPRFVGDRIARQAIQSERKLACDSPEGRLICDEVVPAAAMDAAIARAVEGLTGAGAVSAVGNRRALRIGEEPLDLFRRYCSLYAREQAYCHFSPALIANLERNWNAGNRQL